MEGTHPRSHAVNPDTSGGRSRKVSFEQAAAPAAEGAGGHFRLDQPPVGAQGDAAVPCGVAPFLAISVALSAALLVSTVALGAEDAHLRLFLAALAAAQASSLVCALLGIGWLRCAPESALPLHGAALASLGAAAMVVLALALFRAVHGVAVPDSDTLMLVIGPSLAVQVLMVAGGAAVGAFSGACDMGSGDADIAAHVLVTHAAAEVFALKVLLGMALGTWLARRQDSLWALEVAATVAASCVALAFVGLRAWRLYAEARRARTRSRTASSSSTLSSPRRKSIDSFFDLDTVDIS